MKKIILALVLLLILTLSACIKDDDILDYDMFTDITVYSHAEAQSISEDKYIVYYYQEVCPLCEEVKQDILQFASDFESLDFYIFDTSSTHDFPLLIDYRGTPSVIIFSGEEVLEVYTDLDEVLLFIDYYEDIQLSYDTFTAQSLTTYDEIFEIELDRYLVYYYLEACPNCATIKDEFLAWAYTKNVNQLFFMDGLSVIDFDNLPTELQILSSGTPLLIVMSNGEFTDEYYYGIFAILDYIELDTE